MMGLRDAQIAHDFWGCLGGCFRKRMTFKLASRLKQMTLPKEGGITQSLRAQVGQTGGGQVNTLKRMEL